MRGRSRCGTQPARKWCTSSRNAEQSEPDWHRTRNEFGLKEIPILKCWPNDGGRFITLPNVHTRDPESGARNVGVYRMQIFDDRTTAMHWQGHKGGGRPGQRY